MLAATLFSFMLPDQRSLTRNRQPRRDKNRETGMTQNTTQIQLNLDPTNPGQFFACCGLLELADRLWGTAEGWFEDSGTTFCIRSPSESVNAVDLLATVRRVSIENTMTSHQRTRFKALKKLKKKDQTKSDESDKKSLEKLWRESPLVLGAPFKLCLDWFLDSRAGGSRFKTWAGQQSVIDIARSMKLPVDESSYDDVPVTQWLSHASGSAVTFNFDSDSSVQSSPLDVGFSLDPLKMSSRSRPLLELLAFIGLQRFRPTTDAAANSHTYVAWTQPLLPEIAAAVVASGATIPDSRSFAFPLLYRTKYLKSFLPAQPVGDSQ